MVIPENLEEEHFSQAASLIDNEGVPPRRNSVHYLVVIDGKRYPPKYLISLANIYANGSEYSSDDFDAREAIRYFRKRHFQVIDLRNSSEISISSEDDEQAYPEGRERFCRHRTYERNRAMVTKMKEKRLGKNGKISMRCL